MSSCLGVQDGELFGGHSTGPAVEREKVGVRQSEKDRIAVCAVDEHLKMEMRAGTVTRLPTVAITSPIATVLPVLTSRVWQWAYFVTIPLRIRTAVKNSRALYNDTGTLQMPS